MRTTRPVHIRPSAQSLATAIPAAPAGASAHVIPINGPNPSPRRTPAQRGANPRLLDEARRKTANANALTRNEGHAQRLQTQQDQPDTKLPTVTDLTHSCEAAAVETDHSNTEAIEQTTATSKITHLDKIFPNKQSTNVLDEFTALAMDGVPFHISIIKLDGSVVNEDSLSLIQKRLMNRDGQVLWTLNTKSVLQNLCRPHEY